MDFYGNVSNVSENQCIPLSEEDAYLWLYSPFETIIIIGILPIAGTIGLLANLMFQIAVIKNPDLQTKTNYYLFCLSIFDEITIIGGDFFWFLGAYIASPISYALPFQNCWLICGVIIACLVGSFGLVTLVAFDRYVALCHPITYRNKFTVALTKKIIIGNVIVCVLFSSGFQRWGKNLTLCVIWPELEQYANLPTTINTCGAVYDFPFADIVFFDIPFYIALILNIYMYVMIVRKISGLGAMGSSGTNESNSMVKQVARVLIANAVVFALCQIPYRIISFHDVKVFMTGTGLFTTPEGYEKALMLGRMFLVLNSVINPFLYALSSKFYRQGIKKVFCDSCHSKETKDFTLTSSSIVSIDGPKTDPSGTLGIEHAVYINPVINGCNGIEDKPE